MTDQFEDQVLQYLQRIEAKTDVLAEKLREFDEGLARVEMFLADWRRDRAIGAPGRLA